MLVKRGCSSTPQGGCRYCEKAKRSVTSLPSANSATASFRVLRTSPTLPPKPSRASAMRGWDRRDDTERLHGLGHVMHAHDVGSIKPRQHVGGDRAADPLAGLRRRDLVDKAFARQSHQQRKAERTQFGEPRDHRDALLRRLAETDAGIEHDALARNARTRRDLERAREKSLH